MLFKVAKAKMYNIACGCGYQGFVPCVGSGLGQSQNYKSGTQCSPRDALSFCQRTYPCPPRSFSVARCIRVNPQPDAPQGQLP
jgi:hypothetical protein